MRTECEAAGTTVAGFGLKVPGWIPRGAVPLAVPVLLAVLAGSRCVLGKPVLARLLPALHRFDVLPLDFYVRVGTVVKKRAVATGIARAEVFSDFGQQLSLCRDGILVTVPLTGIDDGAGVGPGRTAVHGGDNIQLGLPTKLLNWSLSRYHLNTIHTLPHLKCVGLVSVRSSQLPFKMHKVGFRAL